MTTARSPRLVVAIDGPSGSGKSSVSRALAQRLGSAFLDTGAMYRAVTWSALENGVDLTDPVAVAAHADEVVLRMGTDPQLPSVHVGDADVSEAVRESRISAEVSAVASVPAVRERLIALQREIIDAARGDAGIVAEGRDITTVVAPDAQVRLLLTADPEIRMARRRLDHGGDIDDTALRDQILRRDADDSTLVNFTTAADGVTQLDGSLLSLEQVIDAVVDLAERAQAGPTEERP